MGSGQQVGQGACSAEQGRGAMWGCSMHVRQVVDMHVRQVVDSGTPAACGMQAPAPVQRRVPDLMW
jgi:hypothetical protein